jgi:diguanylate cyclase (GGDEF)-like protein/PAS domain S-box-containing protein
MKDKSLTDIIQEAAERGIIGAIGDAITIQDTDFTILYQNSVHKALFGDHTGEKCYTAYRCLQVPCKNCHLAETFEKGEIRTLERVLKPPGNKPKHLEITSSPLRDSSGKIAAGIEVIRDVTERKLSAQEIEESENRYRSLVESTDDSIYLVNKNYQYLFMNKKHLSRLGLLGNQFMERAYSEFHSPKETKLFIEKINRIFSTGESSQYEYMSPRDGKYFLQTFSPVKDSDGKITAVTVVSKEITGLKEMEEKLRTLSFTDDLTGLYNRRGFFALAEQQLRIANREKKGRFLLSADLDNLKTVNDTMGHKEGDLVLLQTAIILRRSFRDSDVIARIGGDEFVVLASELIEPNAEALIKRLRRNIEEHNTKTKKPYNLSLSLGYTQYNPEDSCTIDELLSSADHQMYKEKKNRRLSS